MIGQKPLLKLFVSLAIDFVGIVSYFLPVPNLQPYPVHEALSLNDLMLPTFRPGTGARARRGASPEPRGGRFWASSRTSHGAPTTPPPPPPPPPPVQSGHVSSIPPY